MSIPDMDTMMEEVGTLDDSIVACLKTQDGAYAIRFEDLDIFVEVEADRGRVVLSSEIGTPFHARAAEVYETMLSYNLLWRATGGLRMALTGRGGAMTVKIKVAPAVRGGGEVDKITITVDRKLELPKPEAPSDFFWLTDEAEPTRQHPRQHALDLRETKAVDEDGVITFKDVAAR